MPLAKKVFQAQILKKTGDRFSKKKESDQKISASHLSREQGVRNFGAPNKNTTKNIDAGLKPEQAWSDFNKFMANSGVGSRREADELIKMGWWPSMVKRSPRWAIR